MTTTATEHLTTGWEPTTPVHDTILRRYVHAWVGLAEAVATAAGGRAVRHPELAAADYPSPGSWYRTATLLQPPQPSTFGAVLDEVERFYAGSHPGDVHLWSVWPTPDLRDRGWRLEGHPPVLVRPPAALVPANPATGAPAVRLSEVAGAADLAVWERVAIAGYPLPGLVGAPPGSFLDPRILDDDRFSFTIGWDGDEPVSIGARFTDCELSCFALGVTVPAARRRGHWLAHARHRLETQPRHWAAGHFSDDSRPSAERLGFVPLLRTTLWTRSVDHQSQEGRP